MRILVTGSSGQLGRAIAEQLAPDHQIIGVDIRPGEMTAEIGSVGDRETVFRLMKGVDAVIHTASLHAPHIGQKSKAEFVEVNVRGTLNLLEAAVERGVRRFVYTSTTSLYGSAMAPKDKAVWVTEELVPQPRDIYDITKIAAEQLCRHFASEAELPVICLRTSRFWDEAPRLKAIYRLYRGVDVRDAAEAHLLALRSADIQYEVFNISAQSPFHESDAESLLREPWKMILRYFPQAQNVFERMGWALPENIDRVYDITKAKRLLGYRPRYNFAEFIGDGWSVDKTDNE